ncbi:pentapeptide repeat-containing protein [Rhizobium tropici]|nr:pentapeptide repeat-containing protein [Rhizobium tropici]
MLPLAKSKWQRHFRRIMRKISQKDFEANLLAQARENGIDLSDADLSDIVWHGLDLSAATIAMSVLRNAHFSATQSLSGCTWIGNRIENCAFESVPISKAELLHCEFEACAMHAMRFFRTDLSGTIFSSCRFVDVDLSEAVAIRVRFENCSFTHTRLTRDFLFTGTGDFKFSPEGNLNI